MVVGLCKLSCFNPSPCLHFIRCPLVCSQCTQCIYYGAGEQMVMDYFNQILTKLKSTQLEWESKVNARKEGLMCFSIPLTSSLLHEQAALTSAPASTAERCGPTSSPLHPSRHRAMPSARRVSAADKPLPAAPHHHLAPKADLLPPLPLVPNSSSPFLLLLFHPNEGVWRWGEARKEPPVSRGTD